MNVIPITSSKHNATKMQSKARINGPVLSQLSGDKTWTNNSSNELHVPSAWRDHASEQPYTWRDHVPGITSAPPQGGAAPLPPWHPPQPCHRKERQQNQRPAKWAVEGGVVGVLLCDLRERGLGESEHLSCGRRHVTQLVGHRAIAGIAGEHRQPVTKPRHAFLRIGMNETKRKLSH